MVKQLVKGKRYDSYGSQINKQKRFVSQQEAPLLTPPDTPSLVQRYIPADITNMLHQLQVQEPRIKATLHQIEVELGQPHLRTAEATEKSILRKIDNILIFLHNKDP